MSERMYSRAWIYLCSILSNINIIPFRYNLVEYYLLIQIPNERPVKQLHVTAVTEQLSSKIYGSFIFSVLNSKVKYIEGPKGAASSLVQSLIASLQAYLKEQSLI